MAFRLAAVLGLTANLVLAAPGGLRGLSASRTDSTAQGTEAEAAPVLNRTVNTSSDLEGTLLPGFAPGAENLSEAVLASNMTLLGASVDDCGCLRGRQGWSTPQRRCVWGAKTDAREAAACRSRHNPHQGPAPAPVHGNIMTLYHTTSRDIAKKILASGFRPGRAGWCGGAIYFYNSPHMPRSKLGPDSHDGAMIEAKVDMGRMAHLNSECSGHSDAERHYDSITFNPGDGNEFVIFSNDRVISMRRYS